MQRRLGEHSWLWQRWSTSIATSLFLLAAAVSVRAAPHKPLPTEALEKYEDAPVYIFRLGVSPQAIAHFNGFTSIQVNVDANGNNITGDAANEPSIAVDPTNHNHMAIGWRQFNSVASNFRQAGYAFSTNGGASWTFPGVLQNNVFRSDPVLDTDSSGQLFYLSLLQNFYDDVWNSLNGGMSWTRLAAADGGDKEWFMVDKSNSSGHGFQYQWWSTAGNNFNGLQFNRSTDGGVTWSYPVNIPNSPIWGTLDTDTAGNLYLGGVDANTNQIWCERSVNARNAAVSPTFDQSTPVNLGGYIVSGEPINPVGLVGQIYLRADRSPTSHANDVYMLASVQPTGFTSGSDVMFVRSTDFGHSFSAPVRVNDDAVNPAKWHWFGTLSLAPSGRLDAVWYDTRNAANNTDSQLFYSYSVNAGETWSPNVPVSPAFNPFLGYPNQNKIGDYIAMVSDPAGGDVAYSATFNGEEDIYYVRVATHSSHLQNISTRANVLTGDRVLIAGFIIGGTGPKQVIIRGLGPSTGLAGALADPTLELYQGSQIIATNDNWKTNSNGTSQQAAIQATGLAPGNDLESAILITLNPGSYTAILRGKNNTSGQGLVDLYDLTPAGASIFTNISSRGYVSTGNDVMIAGFIIGGGNGYGADVLVRALGPTLSNFGVTGVLADPMLELHNGNGTLIATNDNWQTNDASQQSQQAYIQSQYGLAPPNPLESVIVASLAPGSYTAIVRGKNNTSGTGLIEVYNIP